MQRSMENNTCHGQCYLMQKLKTQQENEQQNFKINFQEGLAVDHHLFSFEWFIFNPISEVAEYSMYTSTLNPRDYIYSLDRPPVLG